MGRGKRKKECFLFQKLFLLTWKSNSPSCFAHWLKEMLSIIQMDLHPLIQWVVVFKFEVCLRFTNKQERGHDVKLLHLAMQCRLETQTCCLQEKEQILQQNSSFSVSIACTVKFIYYLFIYYYLFILHYHQHWVDIFL